MSRQYAGTNALKGDFTRTGERNLSGLMKDGMNSANRYYLNQFRDAYRQATIDLMTGQIVDCNSLPESLPTPETKSVFYNELDESAHGEHVKTVIEDCKRLLIPDLASIIGAWGLIDNDPNTGDPSQEDMDVIFILTRDSYYVAFYDDEVDKVTNYQRVCLSDIELIELGPYQSSFNLPGFKKATQSFSLRIHYRMPPPPSTFFYSGDEVSSMPPDPASINAGANLSGYFHMVRATNLRFFNSMAVTCSSEEERGEALKSVADSIIVTMELGNLPPAPFVQGQLERRKSKMPEFHHAASEMSDESRRSASKVVSNSLKALSNVTTHFSRLNPISKFRNVRSPQAEIPPQVERGLEATEIPQINIDSRQ